MKTRWLLLAIIFFLILYVWPSKKHENTRQRLREDIIAAFGSRIPLTWGEHVPGVKTRLDTEEKVIALTLDACGSANDGFDADLINYLIVERVPATLFINARWIDKNPQAFKSLSSNDLFEIENHGFGHKPCSIVGKSAYGIRGTGNAAEVVDEIEKNAEKIRILTGRKPMFYRSGTAYYDEVAVEIVYHLGYEVVGFSILGDAGATYSKEQVKDAILKRAFAGAIIICHMNHPGSQTSQGLKQVIPELKKIGYRFVVLADYRLAN
ncbi:MAG: polysaccharide deacetylase family protein [Candidatus Omnitrophota bacterium]